MTAAFSAQRLADAVAGAPGVRDLYLERVDEQRVLIEAGRIVRRERLLREGAAVRRHGSLVSADGLERTSVAELLGVRPGALPPLALSPPPPPQDEELLALLPATPRVAVRWIASAAAVVADGAVASITRPALLEITCAHRRSLLSVWPPAAPLELPRPYAAAAGSLAAGPITALLAPQPAAVLLHELFGHLLESDLLLSGGSPWRDRFGERLLAARLDLVDDPTAPLPGGFSSDDEGVPARRRPLLSGGVLVGALADREGAAALGQEPGSARRVGVHEPPRPRLSNLLASGHDECPPLDAAALEIAAVTAGRVEPGSGLLLLAVREAYALSRGRRRRALAPFTLAARPEAICRGLLAAGGAAEVSSEPGWCGKSGAALPIGAAAPWLLISGLEVR